MVLSNKKLKQKLRAAVAESLAASVGGNSQPNADLSHPAVNLQTQSLKGLLDSATQKPRLSKREKRRKTFALLGPETVDRSSGGDQEEEKKETYSETGVDKKAKKKKRKRNGDEELENSVNGSAENVAVKKAKKNKQKKKKKKAKNEEQNMGSGDTNGGNKEQGTEQKNKKKKTENDEQIMGSEATNRGNEEQGMTEAVQISESQENGVSSTKVYVGGIPFYSTEDDIRSYFEGCGTITEVDCMLFPESGKFRGIAIISFKTEAAAKRALAFDGSDMGGLYLKIQPYKKSQSNKISDFAPGKVEGYNRIYVGNLSWDITEDDLKKLFSGCTISSIRFGIDKETEEFRGYAHVDFSDNNSLAAALKLDQQIVCGRPVKIRCAVPKKGSETHSKSAPFSKKADGGMSSGNGKRKRRTYYECGVAGHILSDCPNKQTTDSVNSNAR